MNTRDEAAAFMKSLGAVHAMNLDGGGSTATAVGGAGGSLTEDTAAWVGGRGSGAVGAAR
ncbi:phosphodiester glycosidase family protein [Streptomyces sp. NPDC046870]|uniref:phosphodiester glycosidase family protein n=1 Tax=Streptomyces sp. NPDC046870 TaxID=3155135 RepID=UPI003454776E